jgi:hypothetical protein
MKRIINDLHSRGLHITAVSLEKEIRPEDIQPEAIKANTKRLIAFANRLSALNNPRYKSHAKIILKLVDDANRS